MFLFDTKVKNSYDIKMYDTPENVAVLSLTSLYAITMLLVWTLWSGL
jgi:hypothetical protein